MAGNFDISSRKMEKQEVTILFRANPPFVMTMQEAADVCGVCDTTIRNWIRKCGLKAFREQDTIRILRKHLIAFLNSRSDVSESPLAVQQEEGV